MDPSPFYDDIAQYYDLIYEDWEGSMNRQGAALAEILGLPRLGVRQGCRILDVAAGIGTQAIPLASRGYQVVARDLSAKAVARLTHEARRRGLSIDAAKADMREIVEHVEGTFDVVIALDNSITHLQSDDEILVALRGMATVLTPAGTVLISVRDYETVDRSPSSSHPYGERTRDGRRFRLGQEWTWLDTSHYRTTMTIEELVDNRWTDVVRTDARYYAIPIPRLLGLMEEAGLRSSRVDEGHFFQPVLSGLGGGNRP